MKPVHICGFTYRICASILFLLSFSQSIIIHCLLSTWFISFYISFHLSPHILSTSTHTSLRLCPYIRNFYTNVCVYLTVSLLFSLPLLILQASFLHLVFTFYLHSSSHLWPLISSPSHFALPANRVSISPALSLHAL